MKSLFLGSLLLYAINSRAQTDLEAPVENWLDSTFVANEIQWEAISNEFLRFTQTNFKNINNLSDGYLALTTTSSAKKPEKNDLLKTSGFAALDSFAQKTSAITPSLQRFLLDLLMTSNEWCSQSAFTKYYLLLHEVAYWSLSSHSMYTFTRRLIALKVSRQTLYHKLILILLVDKLFNHYDFVPRELQAQKEREEITIIYRETKPDSTNNATSNTSADEEEPCFLGGDPGIQTYLQNNVSYPEEARMFGIQGIVYASLVVCPDGSLRDVAILSSPDEILSKETMRVIQTMPLWKPGIQAGKHVSVRFTIPISFKISY